MKTLIINAHPDFNNEQSFSLKLENMFIEKYQKVFTNNKLEIINLYDIEIPQVTQQQLLNTWDKQRHKQSLTTEEQHLAQLSKKLLEQFKGAQRIVIVTPLHNFNITSKMKDYMDNIMLARETFKYTKEGSVGLMTDNYKALLLQASGSIYTNDDRYTPLDFSYRYLKEMFENIMGFDKFYVVRAEGTAILPEEEVMQKASQNLDIAFEEFYK
ncbi:NAD(P)H-dependent oxidoreductase [Staphylococcus sp. Marseille-Q5304]|uniref:FMN-dependent NADH-azoreductase n=1 Tax=Staphylococcus sp. Marseille-Q5304 TaxID=2942200 RepID=UPI0020736D1F|nr:NAD(P)H-dependent oxidoreductase [Staphylococcus sp. Marseille-Q5304]